MSESHSMPAFAACRVCGGFARSSFTGLLLKRTVTYFDCDACGYVQTEEPYWLEEAYASPINASDTGIAQRNSDNAKRVAVFLWRNGLSRARVVDFAGGHGLLVRMLRDIGVDAHWRDKYCPNLYARGFEDNGTSADLVTAFEAFEHFVRPTEELASILEIAPSVIFSTLLIPAVPPMLKDWWYYGSEHGQHVGFFRKRTLNWLAERHSAKLITDGVSIHVISKGTIPFDFSRARVKIALLAWPIIRRLHFKSLTWADHLKLSFASDGANGGAC